MNEFIEKLIKKLYESVKRKNCPDEACWEHLNKNCDYCDFKEIKVQDAIEIVNQLAEEHKGGWIPYATDAELPLNNQKVWLSFTSQYTSFVKSAWWVNDHFEWNNGRTVKDVPLAWKPYNVPAPYQPKGE